MEWNIFLSLVVRDKEGRIIKKEEEKCNTYVENFLLLLNAAFDVGTSNIVDTGGVNRAASAKSSYTRSGGYANDWTSAAYGVALCGSGGGWGPDAAAADDTYGIVVGTSDTAVSADDYNLGTKISHGSGTGQLIYGATTLTDPTVDGNKVTQSMSRSWTNDSGAGITVKEIGLILKTNADNYLVMIIRDVITPITVPAAGSLDVTIKITTTA